ncbi:hypothetical protein VB638_11460 [Dolichospermum sp. UHCC 0684]|jgi:hypothetical protein|uniref:hypothetical protein n=1 Tax=Nostocales TaxID=1161 RepID=UPI0011D1ADBF|nr:MULTISPECIES: hypothetical protein [Nostocales]MEA5530194.1 hypothetical protein [Dolichospermum sp. UHCC 0684]MTJ16944.1 hypothetical protein [Dolichospermum sp. UHCC 0299]MTJ21231.1 hypothetical protein [Dolichospermum sp. UHCC 0352]MTJ36593.1 hypothetical protein [Dolichospermum sp. UHCC 0260]MTJ37803.1 hypothetical protein [Dolichospermum sp. UHCC 0406]
MDTTNNNTPTGDNPDNNKTNPNDEEGENCHHKLVWSCDPNSYPRCTSQWVLECELICHLPESDLRE